MEPNRQSDLNQLAELMAGEFNNLTQSQAEPVWYVPLTVWQRPISLFQDSTTLFLEQANLSMGQAPYRQRVLRLSITPLGSLRGQYYALKEPSRYQGGGQWPERLQSLQSSALEELPSCWVDICHSFKSGSAKLDPRSGQVAGTERNCQFEARPKVRCSFSFGAQKICVELGFDIYQSDGTTHLLSYEKGVDPQTGRATWGALMGPFDLVKQQTFPLLS